MRALWKGAINFGLVNIPVGLYSATRHTQAIDLDLLRDSDHSRIHYKKVAEDDGEAVSNEHIVKGYEYQKGEYVVLTDEDFERVQIKSNQIVDIKEFVKLSDIDPRFFDQPYFLAPEKGGAKAYALLHSVLQKTDLVGIAKVVIRPPREHLAAVKPLDGVLVLETMHFVDELRQPAELPEIPKTTVAQKELSMAQSLVETMSDKWEPAKYHDEYREGLMEVIEQKIKSGEKKLPPAKKAGKPTKGKVIDLASLLQQSLGETAKSRKRKPSKQRVAHRKAA
jgi:DNA end-binding protein Ku